MLYEVAQKEPDPEGTPECPSVEAVTSYQQFFLLLTTGCREEFRARRGTNAAKVGGCWKWRNNYLILDVL